MKKLIILLFPALLFAQEQKKIEIYEYKNGVRQPLPTKSIEKQPDGSFNVYDYVYGVRSFVPSEKIEVKENKIKVFEFKKGVLQPLPKSEFKQLNY